MNLEMNPDEDDDDDETVKNVHLISLKHRF